MVASGPLDELALSFRICKSLILNPSQEYSILEKEQGSRLVFLSSCYCVLQGVRKGEGESGVASRLHGFEGAAEVGEGAHRLRRLDLQVGSVIILYTS